MMRPMLTAMTALLPLTAAAQTELTVFHSWPSHAEWQTEIADRYMAQNPDVTITFQAPSTDYDEGLVSVIRQSLSGDQPDVFLVGSHLLGELAARDLMVPLAPMLPDDMAAQGYTPAMLALTQVGGEQVALPWTSSTPVMFYNAELVTQAGGDPDAMPTDWEGIIDLAAAIDALGEGTMGMYYPSGDDDWMTQNLLANAGLAPMEGGEVMVDSDLGRQAIDLYRRFHTEGGQVAITNDEARQQMYAGQLGLYFNSTAAVRSFAREIGDRFAWRTAQMPSMVAGGGVASGGMAATILTDDPDKQAAALDFILYGTGAKAQAFVVQNTGYMPVNEGAKPLLADFYAQNPNWETSATQADRALPWFSWPGRNGVRISQLVLDDMSALANDQMTTDETVDAMAEGIRKLLP